MQNNTDVALSIRLATLINQGNNILNGLSNELKQLETPAVELTQELIVQGGGELFSAFFETPKAKRYGKKFTQALIKKNVESNRQLVIQKYESLFSQWENNVVSLLEQVSSPPSLPAPGNSRVLIGRITRVNRYKQLETKLRHSILELVTIQKQGLTCNYNLTRNIPKPSATDVRGDLKILEISLRKFIERELSKRNLTWWECIPLEIKKSAEHKKSRSETMWPWYPPSSTNIIDYLDFSDYKKIILEPTNWQAVFSRFFKNQVFIESKLAELEPIRNDVAHSRALSAIAVQKTKIYCAEIGNCIKTS